MYVVFLITVAAIMAIGLIALATIYATPAGGALMAYILWRIFEQNFNDKII